MSSIASERIFGFILRVSPASAHNVRGAAVGWLVRVCVRRLARGPVAPTFSPFQREAPGDGCAWARPANFFRNSEHARRFCSAARIAAAADREASARAAGESSRAGVRGVESAGRLKLKAEGAPLALAAIAGGVSLPADAARVSAAPLKKLGMRRRLAPVPPHFTSRASLGWAAAACGVAARRRALGFAPTV